MAKIRKPKVVRKTDDRASINKIMDNLGEDGSCVILLHMWYAPKDP